MKGRKGQTPGSSVGRVEAAALHRGAHRPETSNPGMGKLPAHSSTRRRMPAITGLASMPLRAGRQQGAWGKAGRQLGGWVGGLWR